MSFFATAAPTLIEAPPLELKLSPNAAAPATPSTVLESEAVILILCPDPAINVDESTSAETLLPIVSATTAPAPSKWKPLPEPELMLPPPAIAHAWIAAEPVALTTI